MKFLDVDATNLVAETRSLPSYLHELHGTRLHPRPWQNDRLYQGLSGYLANIGKHLNCHQAASLNHHFEGLMMSSKNGVRQIIEAFAAIFTFITLFDRFFFIESPFDYSFGITMRTLTFFRPAQFPNSVVTLCIINQSLYVYLHPLGYYGEWIKKFTLYHYTTLKRNMSLNFYT